MNILRLKYSWDNETDMNVIREFFNEKYPDIKVSKIKRWKGYSGKNFNQYFIQFTPNDYPRGAHFEYWADGTQGFIEFHLEPTDENRPILKKIGIRLMHHLTEKDIICYERGGIPFGCFRINERNYPIFSINDLFERFELLYSSVNPIIKAIGKQIIEVKLTGDYIHTAIQEDILYPTQESAEVTSSIIRLQDVMNMALSLPDYQRDYSWEERNIVDLWNNIFRVEDGAPFHLGTLIFHANDNRYDIIDGQQRLVTLSLILWGLGYSGNIPLLHATYSSPDAIKNVANCKYLIKSLIERVTDPEKLLKRLLNEMSFAVLVVNNANLELAYTFFSNQNSKGVPLSDFDLLKAHHLRFIPGREGDQAEHMAKKWNMMSQMPPKYKEKNSLERVLGSHLHRLRRWMRKKNSKENSYRYIQREFQAAPTMPDIPPFGEQFHFYEKIQGGTHFFVYAETFIHRYEQFCDLQPVKLLHTYLSEGRYELFGDAIETLLFGYYLKFGNQYLAEALFCISRLVALYRYNTYAVASTGIGVREFAKDSETVLMIDQATSPTFFFAEILQKFEDLTNDVKYSIRTGLDLDEAKGVRWGIYISLRNIFKKLSADITEQHIRRKIQEEYGN